MKWVSLPVMDIGLGLRPSLARVIQCETHPQSSHGVRENWVKVRGGSRALGVCPLKCVHAFCFTGPLSESALPGPLRTKCWIHSCQGGGEIEMDSRGPRCEKQTALPHILTALRNTSLSKLVRSPGPHPQRKIHQTPEIFPAPLSIVSGSNQSLWLHHKKLICTKRRPNHNVARDPPRPRSH